jgi:hypothetical protein
VAVGVAQVAADLGAAVDRRSEELGAPAAPVRVDGLDVRDPRFRKLLVRSGSGGVSSVTVGLSSVGPPPALMMIQPFARATIEGSPSHTVSPPNTSV